MDVFGISVYYILGAVGLLGVIAAALLAVTLVFASIALFLFWRTRKILIPKISILAMNVVGTPLLSLLSGIGFERNSILSLMVDMKNRAYREVYCKTPYDERAIFIPQCLRHPKCPAPLTPEGIKCISCGQCGLGKLRDEVEGMGGLFFIAPGSTLIKRMIKKYRPKAVVGVGCIMEVKEGIDMMASIKIPVQGVILTQTGCVNTRVNVKRLLEVIKADNPDYHISDDPKQLEKSRLIGDMWQICPDKPVLEVKEETRV